MIQNLICCRLCLADKLPSEIVLDMIFPFLVVNCQQCNRPIEERELSALKKAKVIYRECRKCLVNCSVRGCGSKTRRG